MSLNRSRLIMNIVIVVLVIVGVIVMINSKASATGLTETGWANLKFYTVLSNIFAGVVALVQIIMDLTGRRYLKVLKLTATAAVTLTFLVVAGFFGPLYGWLKLYKGSNLFFHLIVPVLCVIEFIFSGDDTEIGLRHCVIASLSTVVYGLAYLINILINGKGIWPKSNDWYGFLNWGFGMGMVIFAGIIAVNFGVACALRKLRRKKG
ncbi:MAG: hypothetical protein J5509_07050 [Lachnospiraceae bacterium]|nr:hypothetical protein [Lachnospiraceae bacterium]